MASVTADSWGKLPSWEDTPSWGDSPRPTVRRRRRSNGCSPALATLLILVLASSLVVCRALALTVPRLFAAPAFAQGDEATAFLAPAPPPPARIRPSDRGLPAAGRSIPPTIVPSPTPSATARPSPNAIAPGAAIIPPTRAPPLTSSPAPTTIPTSPTVGPSPSPTAEPVLVFLDPGHGGVDTGTIGTTADGTEVDEKNIALAIAQRTAAHLRADGISVALSRSDDSLPDSVPDDYTADGQELTPSGVLADLQRRIERANASGAAVLLSIHLNAYTDPSVRGAETFYDSSRPFAAESQEFATLVQTNLIAAMRAQGDDTPDRGVTDDAQLVTETLGSTPGYNHLVLLGPAIPGRLKPSDMPGALSEPLFLTDPVEAAAALDPSMQELIATAYTRAIEQFLQKQAVG